MTNFVFPVKDYFHLCSKYFFETSHRHRHARAWKGQGKPLSMSLLHAVEKVPDRADEVSSARPERTAAKGTLTPGFAGPFPASLESGRPCSFSTKAHKVSRDSCPAGKGDAIFSFFYGSKG